MTEHRCISIRQPWASPVVDGHKPVENRGRGFNRRHRGRLWIHASGAWARRGMTSPLVRGAYPGDLPFDDATVFPTSAILGHVDLVDAHVAEPGCCESPWAETSFVDSHDRLRTDPVHLVLASPHRLATPIPAGGKLGIWVPDPDLAHELDLIDSGVPDTLVF